MTHIPVLQNEVLKYLAPKSNENFVDATIGLAGHTKAILEKIKPRGKILGIEVDPELYRRLKEKSIKRLILVNNSYTEIKEIVEKNKFKPIKGILFDLGLSSWHLEKSRRGFTFQKDEPLIMNYELENRDYGEDIKIKNILTAEKIVNGWSEKELEKIFREYGEEKFAKNIAEEIIRKRKYIPIKSTFQLVEIIKKVVPIRYQTGRRSPATKTFQALRIAVNRELENLKTGLSRSLEILERGGRLVIISFHSLEDRIVKNFFRDAKEKGRIRILTKKPSRPGVRELRENVRARSAKLRAVIKI